MKTSYFIISFLVVIFAATLLNQYRLYGSFSGVYVVVVWFLILNILVNYWEFILWKKIDLIEATSNKYYQTYINEKATPLAQFMNQKMSFSRFFSASFWSGLWVAYSMYDRSYADKKSFGFAIGVGTGLSTLIPCLILYIGFLYHFFEAKVFGIIMLALMWQMAYGTLVYWFSFIVNKRYELLSKRQNFNIIVGSNISWLIFSLVGIYAAIRLIFDNNFSVFGI
ncbi:MAG: hypothetical protein IPN25_09105 [Sphingobacteriales bacterium]|nr:hypothetical protein [Sphingobacteriales bacterium]